MTPHVGPVFSCMRITASTQSFQKNHGRERWLEYRGHPSILELTLSLELTPSPLVLLEGLHQHCAGYSALKNWGCRHLVQTHLVQCHLGHWHLVQSHLTIVPFSPVPTQSKPTQSFLTQFHYFLVHLTERPVLIKAIPVLSNYCKVQSSFSPIIIWSNHLLVQLSFGPKLTWIMPLLVMYSNCSNCHLVLGSILFILKEQRLGVLQDPDTHTHELANTGPFLHFTNCELLDSIRSKEFKYHILSNIGTPEVFQYWRKLVKKSILQVKAFQPAARKAMLCDCVINLLQLLFNGVSQLNLFGKLI